MEHKELLFLTLLFFTYLQVLFQNPERVNVSRQISTFINSHRANFYDLQLVTPHVCL